MPSKGTAEYWRVESTQKSLMRHFLEKVESGSARGRDGLTPAAFSRSLPKEIRHISRDLRENKYRFSPYLLALKLKGQGKSPREISIPTVRDRVVLRALGAALSRSHSFCSLELPQSQIGRVINALEQDRYNYFLKVDVKDFYPTIRHEWLEAVLRKRIPSRRFRNLLMQAVRTSTLPAGARRKLATVDRGIPQGLAVSNGLAELSVRHLDEMMQSLPGIAYFRYVDDILIFMVRDDSEKILTAIIPELSRAGLEMHPVSEAGESKSSKGRIDSGFEFLGYRFMWPRVTVRETSFIKLEARIARIFTRYKYILQQRPTEQPWRNQCLLRLEWHLNLTITGCFLEGKRYGWLSYFSQIRHHQLLEHLDWLATKQMRRFDVEDISPKTFVKSYRFAASRREDPTGYVPNFDSMSANEKRQLLVDIFSWGESKAANCTDEEIEAHFLRRIRHLAIELERDISASY